MATVAVVVMDLMGWLPAYLQAFVFIAACAGSLVVVNLRALEPITRPWFLASLGVGVLAILGSLPGAWICIQAEDVPLGFIGPFLILLVSGVYLISAALGGREV